MRAFTIRKRPSRSARLRRCFSYAALGFATLAATGAAAQNYRGDPERCRQLEQQLVGEWQRGNNPQDAVVRLNQQLEGLQRERRKLEIEADRRECYEEFFIFGRSLRRTKACIQLDGDIERLRRDISTVSQRREALTNTAQRRLRRDDLVAELARYGCGENYERENAARRKPDSFFSLWEDDDSAYDRGYANRQRQQSDLPFASYRTMCVRLCDGYYFPVSFSTLASRFQDDEIKCKDQCAAPAELFIYKNPGEDVEQMVSLGGEPYNNLKNAWRHRKDYVKGCSCKPGEYSAHEIELHDQGGQKQASASASKSGSASTQDANQSNTTIERNAGPIR